MPLRFQPGTIEIGMGRSSDFFELAVREAGLGVWEWNIATNEVSWSAEVHPLLGAESGQFGGTYQAYLELLFDEDRERVVAAIDAALASGDRFAVEHRVRRSDGSVGWLAAYGNVLCDSNGKPRRMIGVVKDITDRKLAEQQLQESEDRFRSLAEAAVEAIVFGTRGRVLDVNPAAIRLLGCDSASDLIGRPISDFVHPDDLGLVRSRQQLATPDSYMHRALRKDGSVLWVEATGRKVAYRGEEVRMTALRDVTARIEAEAELRQRDEFIRSIVETSRDWIWAVDIEGHHTYSNLAVETILGYQLEAFEGGSAFRLMHPEDVDRAVAMVRECLAKKVGWDRVVFRWSHADGSYRTLESSAVPMLDEGGEVIGFRGVDRDITERLDMEAEKTRLEDQLRHAQKMEAVGQLAGGIAHDFNNLLSVISGNVQILNDTLRGSVLCTEEIGEELQEIEQAADRAVALTSQLLAFSRRQVTQPTSLDLNDVLERLRGMLRRLLAENIDLRLRTAASLPSVLVDSGQLEQVIVNLVVNARDAMPEGGLLTLQTESRELSEDDAAALVEASPGRFVVLMVSDTGVGMAPDVAGRIFEPFFTTKRLGRGTGLGLSTVYGIVRQADGFINVYSEPGRGATFSIYLPAREVSAHVVERRGVDPGPVGGNETVLVCEDDPSVRRLAVRMLARAGYRVLEAPDGEEALRVEFEHPDAVDVLLTDVIMPGMNGRELAAAMKKRRPALKTIYFSGYAADVISNEGVLEPGVEFLQKPFVRQELLARVRRVLGERQ